MKKLTYEYVYNFFKEHDCELLAEEYENARTKMPYKCSCGNVSEITFDHFKRGRRCSKCAGNEKLTYKEVYNYFKEHNCELLITEYINANTKMPYKCSCGNDKCEITFASFKQGCRCMECSGSKKYSYDYVYNYFKEQHCELLAEEYKNNHTLMPYRCECGNDKCKIRFFEFKQGQRCRECAKKKIAEKLKFTYKEVYEYFKEQKCELLSKSYENQYILLDYICNCGKYGKICFASFKRGSRCNECGQKKVAEKLRFTYKEVYNYFKEQRCELLTKEYRNAHIKLEYICHCGNRGKTSFEGFKKGARCKECTIKKISGENHYNYNPDLTDEERIKKRDYPEYIEWVKKIYEKDDYTCECCGERGVKLCAHHLESYGSNEELRTVVSNGITLCEKDHIEFHKEYGYGNNTKKQFEEFLNNRNG